MVLRIAVIGSGPAAQYTVQHIAKRCGERSLAVDIFEQHPFPYGLVRYGIAADHQDAKHVANRFDTFLSSSSSSSPNFRVNWVGGVKVGDRITVKHLRQHYNAVLFANGAQEPKSLFPSNDKTIRASYSAHHLVSWLNGLPEAFQHAVPLAEDLQSTDTAVIVGQGNVALDVARILLTNVDALMKTDIPEPVLDVLAKSRISRVHLVARRGPLQMAFTSKELREMTRLPSASLLPNPLLSTDPYRTADSNPAFDRSPKRLMQILLNHHAQPTSSSAHKTWSLDWFLSPHRLLSSPADPTKLTGIQFQQTRSIPTAATPGASVESVPGAFVDVSCGIIFSSLGYKGVAVPSAAEAGIPFDAARGVIPNNAGRVVDPDTQAPIPGVYASGWIKRGAVGVIAATMYDAVETAESVVRDWDALMQSGGEKRGFEGVRPLLKGCKLVSFEQWQVLDEHEKAEGAKLGKVREKIVSVEDAMSLVESKT